MDNFDLSGRIERVISWNDADQQIDEFGDDDDENCEEHVDWHTGDCDDELEESADTMGPPTNDPELLEQFDGNLDADASASQVYAPASRSFQEARELLLSCVQSGRGYFPVVGIGARDGLAQPSTDRKPAKLRGNGKKSKRNGKTSSYKVECFQALVTWSLAKTPTSRPEPRPLMSKKRPTETGTTRGGPHQAPRVSPDRCILCGQVGHRASECPNIKKSTSLSPCKFTFGNHAQGCAVFDATWYGTTVEETEEDHNPNDIADCVAFSRVWKGFSILDGRATKTVSGCTSVQPMVNQCGSTRGYHD